MIMNRFNKIIKKKKKNTTIHFFSIDLLKPQQKIKSQKKNKHLQIQSRSIIQRCSKLPMSKQLQNGIDSTTTEKEESKIRLILN